MTIVLPTLRLMALLLSILGYVGFFRAFCAIPKYIAYLFTLSVITCAMYFAGLAGVMLTAAYVLLGLGGVLFLIVILSGRLHVAFRRPTFSLVNVLFLLWFVITCVSLFSYRLIHYDNFSHWALVVKQMLITNAIPDANSSLIDFKNYPLGTSSFLYYVGRIVGHSDGLLLIGQAMLLFACFYALYGIIRDEKRFLLAAVLGLSCAIMSFFNISIRINNLLVDYLLPLCALAAIAGMTESARNYRVACIVSIPVLAFLVIIKNTGLFFAIPCYLYLFYIGHGARKGKRFYLKLLIWVGSLLAIAISLATLIVWNIHTKQAFASETSKFSLDLSALSSVRPQELLSLNLQSLSALVKDKTPEQIQSIVTLFIQSITSIHQLATQGLLLINLLAVVAWLNARFGFAMRWKLLKVLILMDVLMAVYYAGILVFYIVAMPLDEALRLAGFERYACSMVLFVIGSVGICAVRDIECSLYVQQGEERDYRAFKSLQSKSVYQYATLIAFGMATVMLMTDINGMNILQKSYSDTLPAHAETALGSHWNAADTHRYLLYAPDTDSQVTNDYLLYVGRYLLFDPNVATTATADATLLSNVKNYDYFAIVESDPAIQTFMREHTGLAGDVGVYSVQDLFGKGNISGLTQIGAPGSASAAYSAP